MLNIFPSPSNDIMKYFCQHFTIINTQSQADSLGHEDLNVKVLMRLTPTVLLLSNIVNTEQRQLVRRLGN